MIELGSYELPKGWRWATIPELVGRDGVFIDGDWVESKDQDPDGDVRLIQLADVGDGAYRDKSARFLTSAKASELGCTFLKPGDVLVARMPDPLGRACIFPGDPKSSVTVVDVCIVRSGKGDFDHRWLSWFVNAHPFRSAIAGLQAGSTRKRISRGNLATIPLPVPPFDEQRRIVAEIEKQFTRLEAGIAALRRVQANLKRYRATVLKAACEGRLVTTEAELAHKEGRAYESADKLLARILTERRERWAGRGTYKEPAAPVITNHSPLPVGWVWATVEQSTNLVATGATPYRGKAAYWEDGQIPWVTSGALNYSLVTSAQEFITSLALEETNAKLFPPGTLLIALYGEGKTRGLVSELRIEAATNQACAALLFGSNNDGLRAYLKVFLQKNYEDVRLLSSGGVQPNLSLSIVKNTLIPLPPLAEQNRIVAEVERRLSVIAEIEAVGTINLQRAIRLRQAILQQSFTGTLVAQDPQDEPASKLLDRIRVEQDRPKQIQPNRLKRTKPHENMGGQAMRSPHEPKYALEIALAHTSDRPSASDLFSAGKFERDQVHDFYDAIADSTEAVTRLSNGKHAEQIPHPRQRTKEKPGAPFRLHELWIKKFKNLEDYSVMFDPQHALDVLLGWNGTGKSNLFEVLIVIFRDLHKWQTKNKWTPEDGLEGYRIRYELGGRLIEVAWDNNAKRPELKINPQYRHESSDQSFEKCSREELPLPHFVFGYYSGPSNRFAELFSEPKQDHYDRLLKQKADDDETLARLLEERRFFNAETHHAKYALLAFFYEDDPGIHNFLKKHLRIENLESVLFVLKRPRWHRNNKPEDFWGADGLLRPVLERLRRHSIAPMVLPQRVDDAFQESTRDHYFLLLPNKTHLQALAAEYSDPISFFVALESTDFSSIIHEVRIRVRINATATKQTIITFKEMSDGEQQLLMVLGLLRFTKMNQSLVLLDEPDTHLNPHWQLGYLHLLLDAMVGSGTSTHTSQHLLIEELEKRLSSQVLLSTHDPLAIAGLLKENIHLLKRRDQSEECVSVQPTENPRGMGFTGILTSEMFGLKSDLDDETLSLLDQHADLAGKKRLSLAEQKKLKGLTAEVESLGFKSASSDPYYRVYLQALARRRKSQEILTKKTWNKSDIDSLGKETDEILEEIEREEKKK